MLQLRRFLGLSGGGGRFFLFLHGVLEVLDSFADTLGYFRNLLAAKKQHGDSEDYHQFGSGKATYTGRLYGLSKIQKGTSQKPLYRMRDGERQPTLVSCKMSLKGGTDSHAR